ncbi:MAG TPA: MBL fold metallo-hydrolase [Rhodothermales bacterium]|nr:MBL fold metallo-hydrolase [Rhodothermales bacterium]
MWSNQLKKSIALVFTTLFVVAWSMPAQAQDDMADVQITATEVAEGVYMLEGRGGNIGVSVGTDGAFIIDDQFAPLTERILAAVAELSDQPVRFVVNTHWHGDHTGGNENMGEAGAIIVAHENVRERMSTEQFNAAFDRTTPPAPEGAWPVVTFTDAITFHWNGDDIHVLHVEPAHTDGDAVIHFANANVVHMGDTYFNGFYPYIDVSSGGTLDGIITAADRVLALADDDTKIIPGHGPLSNKAELQAYHDMLVGVRDNVQNLIADGTDRQALIDAKPTADFDDEWGGGFMQPDVWVGILYDAVAGGE